MMKEFRLAASMYEDYLEQLAALVALAGTIWSGPLGGQVRVKVTQKKKLERLSNWTCTSTCTCSQDNCV